MRKQWLTLLSVAIVAMLVLAACGSGDDDDDDASGDSGELSGTPVAMQDAMRFDPDTLTVKAGSEVEIALTNEGAIEHNMTIEDADVDQDLDGGESTSFTFTAPDAPGEYQIHCNVPGHEAAGMVATLIVED
jgi:plastocyanin